MSFILSKNPFDRGCFVFVCSQSNKNVAGRKLQDIFFLTPKKIIPEISIFPDLLHKKFTIPYI